MENKRRLIDADALIQNHGNDVTNWDNPYAVKISSIEHAPTVDAVEVVRCRECKNMIPQSHTRYCTVWNAVNGMGDDGFCNYGERKDGD